MNNTEINTLRDIAIGLRSFNPKASYELFKIALSYRPNGPFLIKSCKELKNQLGIVNFFIIGNCQSDIIAGLLKEKSDRFKVVGVIHAHLYKEHSDDIYKKMSSADFIITQNIGDGYNGIDTKTISNLFSDKVIKIPNIFFKGFCPDWCYLPTVKGIRCRSPIGDYHNQTILESFIYGLSESEALANFNSNEYNLTLYKNVARDSLNELKKRELDLDIIISDTIEDSFYKKKCNFHTFNHPNKKLLNVEVNRVLDFIKLDNYKKETNGDRLDSVKLSKNLCFDTSVNREIITHGNVYDLNGFISESYNIYKKNPVHVERYKQQKLIK